MSAVNLIHNDTYHLMYELPSHWCSGEWLQAAETESGMATFMFILKICFHLTLSHFSLLIQYAKFLFQFMFCFYRLSAH